MRLNGLMVLGGVLAVAHAASARSNLFYPFSLRYIVLVSAALILFALAYGAGRLLFRRRTARHAARWLARRRIRPARSRRIFVALFLVFTVLTLLDRALLFGPGFIAPEMVMQYRILLTQEGGTNAIKGLSLGNFFIFLLPTFLLAQGPRLRAPVKLALILLFLLNVYLSSARSALFLPLLIALYFWAVGKRLNVGFLFRALAAVAALYFGFELMGTIVGKGTDKLGFVVYLAAPLHAFDAIVNDPSELRGYWLSFFPLHGVLDSLFGIEPASELPNVFTPLPANVYSIFGVYYSDFGTLGMMMWMAFYGALTAFLDKAYRLTRSDALRAYVALNMAILTLGVFYDYYTTSGVVWLTMVLTPYFFGPTLRGIGREPRPTEPRLSLQGA